MGLKLPVYSFCKLSVCDDQEFVNSLNTFSIGRNCHVLRETGEDPDTNSNVSDPGNRADPDLEHSHKAFHLARPKKRKNTPKERIFSRCVLLRHDGTIRRRRILAVAGRPSPAGRQERIFTHAIDRLVDTASELRCQRCIFKNAEKIGGKVGAGSTPHAAHPTRLGDVGGRVGPKTFARSRGFGYGRLS